MIKILFLLLRSVIAWWRSVRKMGCFLGCFRFGDEGKQKYRLFSKIFSWKKREPAVPRNRCSSVASSEEKDTPCEVLEHWIFQEHFDGDDKIHKDLREEAKFLKTCGTILETPAEICKNSVQNLMISAACRKRINCDQHCHKSSDLPLMIHETIINIENLERCQLGEHDEPKRTVQSEEKDSEVEEVMGSAASETSPTQAEILVPTSSCDSPYPTPLILVDGMQTPGTIYPPKAENIRIGKIRSQFIYPVEDFCQNSFKSKVACENSNFVQSNIRMKGEPPFDVSEIEAAMDVTQEPICSGVICDIERAVIGVVVAQRNEDKTSCVSSKQWVGNGFPNSTSKYKEDQKVSWHATPFEVRLDKVLSDEKLHQQSYDSDDMKKHLVHLLVMSHVYSVPSLKSICIRQLEREFLTAENVVDILQLARECDAPRLSMICTRMIIRDFKSISLSQGWKVMRKANPNLEQELLEILVEVDSRRQQRLKKMEEKKVYMQLHEAMEALVHICRDGCRTIGPRDQTLKQNQGDCNFSACKSLESLVRHFSSCMARSSGSCAHCKRMWQLLELHSRMCPQTGSCKVPLCRHFKDKAKKQSKKEEQKWKLLVRRVMAARGTITSISAWRPILV